jgi:hypothetical protein
MHFLFCRDKPKQIIGMPVIKMFSNRNSSVAEFVCAPSMASILDGASPLWGLSVANH